MRQRKTVYLETTIARSDEVLTSEVDGEVVMMSIEQGTELVAARRHRSVLA